MAIFDRLTARQRLRRATRESLAVPAFSSPVDCTAWVTGGLWPAELSTATPETGTLADYLKADLQRITTSANDELKIIKRAGMPDPVRQAEEARVIDEARARAVRRVESTVRHLHAVKAQAPTAYIGRDMANPQAIPAITDEEPAADAVTHSTSEPLEPGEKERNNAPVAHAPAGPAVDEEKEPEGAKGRCWARLLLRRQRLVAARSLPRVPSLRRLPGRPARLPPEHCCVPSRRVPRPRRRAPLLSPLANGESLTRLVARREHGPHR